MKEVVEVPWPIEFVEFFDASEERLIISWDDGFGCDGMTSCVEQRVELGVFKNQVLVATIVD